ncbi:MAG: hypothetical protein WEC59_05370 [Salibacteraceae bacterium]
MHTLLHIALLSSFICYKLVELTGQAPSFLTSYFEDIIVMPLLLKTALITIQSLSKRWSDYVIKVQDIVIITVLMSIYFEGVLPYFNPVFTADIIDVVYYSFGSLFFVSFLNKPMKKISLPS